MFADPLDFTLSVAPMGEATIFRVVDVANGKTVRVSPDGIERITIAHQSGPIQRSLFRADKVLDPAVGSTTPRSVSVYLNLVRPQGALTAEVQAAILRSFCACLAAAMETDGMLDATRFASMEP